MHMTLLQVGVNLFYVCSWNLLVDIITLLAQINLNHEAEYRYTGILQIWLMCTLKDAH